MNKCGLFNQNYKLMNRLFLIVIFIYLLVSYVCCQKTPVSEKDYKRCPAPIITIPKPGMQGIILTRGDYSLVFQIDVKRSGIPLDWNEFVSKYPLAYVRIKVPIRNDGSVGDVRSIEDFGSLAASNMILSNVRHWKYEPACMSGDLYITFSAVGVNKIVTNSESLRPLREYANCEIEFGTLYHVIGLRSGSR